MKRTLILGIMIVTALALCACGSTSGGKTNNTAQTTVGQTQRSQSASTSTTVQTTTPSIDYGLNEYAMAGTMNGGYSYTATLKIGSWVKASDTDTINRIWKMVGGSGALPSIDNFTYNNWSSGIHFSKGTSIMAFGTVAVEDTTQGGFNLADSSQVLSVDVYSPDLDNAALLDSYVQYSSSGSYLHSEEVRAYRVLHLNPKMEGRTWGPIPFVICVNEAISPEYPDGKPEAMNATWSFGDNKFIVSPMWVNN